jgi:hypothetical protein
MWKGARSFFQEMDQLVHPLFVLTLPKILARDALHPGQPLRFGFVQREKFRLRVEAVVFAFGQER